MFVGANKKKVNQRLAQERIPYVVTGLASSKEVDRILASRGCRSQVLRIKRGLTGSTVILLLVNGWTFNLLSPAETTLFPFLFHG